MKALNHMKLQFPASSVNEGFGRSAVAAFVAQMDPTIDELADIKTAVSEAVTNCIIHAYPEQMGSVYITAQILPEDRIVIKVRDKGCGIADIRRAMEPLYTTGSGERAGLGFAVMQSFMDKLRVTSKVGKGTCVTMEKIIHSRKTTHV